MTLDLANTAELFRLLSDESRVRLLALVEHEELTVAEIVRITRLAQSRVSTHLGKLREAGLVIDRPHGASTYYRLNEDGMPEPAASAYRVMHENLRDTLLEKDRRELAAVIEGRKGGDETWAESVAGQMDRHYSPGRTWESTAWGVLGLALLGHVLDVAAGDGVTAELLSSRARSVTCVDASLKVAAAGNRRLSRIDNVRYVRGDMHELPFRNESFDQALLLHALTYSEAPERVFRELSRVLKPGGTLVVTTLEKHKHREVLEKYNHVQLGFEPDDLKRRLRRAGFQVDLSRVTSREKRPPHHGVVTVHAGKPAGEATSR